MLRGFEEFGDLPPLEAMPRAKAAAQRALQLDPELAEGHTWSGVIEFLYDWDPVAAESFFRRAIELRPDYSLAHTWYAVFLMARGRHDEAIARSEHAAELDPLALTIQALIGQCHYFARRYEEALDRHRATLEMDPGNLRALIWSARAYRVTGRPADALPLARAGRSSSGAGCPCCSASWVWCSPFSAAGTRARAVLAEPRRRDSGTLCHASICVFRGRDRTGAGGGGGSEPPWACKRMEEGALGESSRSWGIGVRPGQRERRSGFETPSRRRTGVRSCSDAARLRERRSRDLLRMAGTSSPRLWNAPSRISSAGQVVRSRSA